MGDRIDPVADLGVAGDRADGRIDEPARQIRDRILLEQRIGVEGDDDAAPGLREAEIDRIGLAAIRHRDELDVGGIAETPGNDRRGSVGRAIVDDDHFKAGIVACEYPLDRFDDHLGLVMRRE